MKYSKLRQATLLIIGLSGCGSSGSSSDGGSSDMAQPSVDAALCSAANYTEDVTQCVPAANDYQPRNGVPGANGWPACISDDDTWHLIGTGTPSAAARSQAFEAMALKLWSNPQTPSKDDFLAARDAYSTSEGLASRVARRQDIHYPAIPGDDKFACQQAGIPEQYPDRCAGPAKLKPIIDDAFVQGLDGIKPIVQSARIEAALIWFFYLSLSSEVWTCSFSSKNDCDSTIGYYTQVTPRTQPVGMAAYIAPLGLETHNRIYDALLAIRCWRDIDQQLPAQEQYMNYYNLAQDQLNKAALRGVALMLRQHIGLVACTTDERQQAHIEFTKVIGGLINHAASLIDAGNAAILKSYTLDPSADTAAVATAQAAIDVIFTCP